MFSMIVVHVTQSIQEWTGYQIAISDSKRYSKFFFQILSVMLKKHFCFCMVQVCLIENFPFISLYNVYLLENSQGLSLSSLG